MKVVTTAVPNLVKQGNGLFYARVRVFGKLHWRSLDTTSFTVAKLRLPDKVAELRSSNGADVAGPRISPQSTFEDVAKLYRAEVNANARLKPRAKDFRLRLESTFRRTWPALFEMEIRRVSAEACQAWQTLFENGGSTYRPTGALTTVKGNSPTTINAAIAYLRRVFDIGVKAGLLYRNPAQSLQRKRPNRKLLRLPNRTQFAAVVAHIRAQPGWGRKAGDLVEGLAYSGMRVGEARIFCAGHVDFEKGMATILGEKTDSAPRIVPMTADFRALMERMLGKRRHAPGKPVFEAYTAIVSLRSACAAVGVPRLTHHDLRHLFATTCIEAGVDIPTVAKWLGHSDGGALAMKTYGHIRPEHSAEAAKKVSFAPPQP